MFAMQVLCKTLPVHGDGCLPVWPAVVFGGAHPQEVLWGPGCRVPLRPATPPEAKKLEVVHLSVRLAYDEKAVCGFLKQFLGCGANGWESQRGPGKYFMIYFLENDGIE